MICVINCGSDWIDDVGFRLSELDRDFKIVQMEDLDSLDDSLYSSFIISGSSILRDEAAFEKNVTKLKSLFSFVKTTVKPVLGICFGHQMIGLLYGSAFTVKSMIFRNETIEILTDNELFEGIKNNSEFQENHKNHITVPDKFELLARSDSSDNEAMKHVSKPIYAVQFHPEVSGDQGKQLIQNFVELNR